MSAFRGIIFDKDGTLFDFSSTWEAWAQSLLIRLARDEIDAARLGASIGFDFQARRFERDSIAIAGTAAEIAEVLVRHLQGISLPELLRAINEEAAAAPQLEAAPLAPLLGQLRGRDLRLGVVTNDAEAPALAHLERAEVRQLFDFIAGFDSGFGAKPAPGQLLAFAQAMGLHPQEVLMVGDSLHDLMAAKAAGMGAVGVLTGMAATEELSPHALAVLPDIGHLPLWLDDGMRRLP